jgi:phospholipid transport system substrate-binding protein
VTDINNVIASGKSETAMYRDFERIFGRYSDTSYIAAYAMGVDGRRASAAQKKAFSKAFQGYISRKYGQRFREFIGGRLEVTGVKRVKKWYEVSTIAYLQGQSPFEVTFLVSDRSGKDLFFNMYIEGVNLLLTERTEIGAILDRNRGDIDKMIAELKRLS